MNNSSEVIIVAGGQGRRMETEQTKAFLILENKPLLIYTIETFAQVNEITGIIVVVPRGLEEKGQTILKHCQGFGKITDIVAGGARRQDSVMAGLDHLHQDTNIVLIHDAARIFTTTALIRRVIQGARDYGAAIPGIVVTDTLKRIDKNQKVEATIERRQMVAIQTPQGFEKTLLVEAYRQAWQEQMTATDDAGLVEASGQPVKVVVGDHLNFKLTTPGDLEIARAIIKNRGMV